MSRWSSPAGLSEDQNVGSSEGSRVSAFGVFVLAGGDVDVIGREGCFVAGEDGGLPVVQRLEREGGRDCRCFFRVGLLRGRLSKDGRLRAKE